jgi:hypothetical protein
VEDKGGAGMLVVLCASRIRQNTRDRRASPGGCVVHPNASDWPDSDNPESKILFPAVAAGTHHSR